MAARSCRPLALALLLVVAPAALRAEQPTNPQARTFTHRVELWQDRWYDLTDKEWVEWDEIQSQLRRVRHEIKKGGNNHPTRHRLDDERDTLERNALELRRRLRAPRADPWDYYTDHDKRRRWPQDED